MIIGNHKPLCGTFHRKKESNVKKFLDWVLDNTTVIILYIAMLYYAVKQNREYTFAFIVLILLYLILKTVSNIEKILKDKE